MLVIDDALLLDVLAGVPSGRLEQAFEAGELFTTGSWYYRLSSALRNRRVQGALSTAFDALDSPAQRLVRANLTSLPASIGLLDYRTLVPIMTALEVDRPLNMLAADAVATAIVVEGEIVVSTEAPLVHAAATRLGIDYSVL